jgi:hypothetical protein
MDIVKLYQDFQITYVTEGRNVGEGWVNIHCPFCPDPSEHLGYDLAGNFFNCWRCGAHSIPETIARVLKISLKESHSILKRYGGEHQLIPKKKHEQTKPFIFPSGTNPLTHRHLKYLEGRGFDPDQITKDWGLMGTGPSSMIDDRDYKHRIIIPIRWNGEVVSFQGRDITGKTELRYKSCPKEREIIHHKDIIYGNQNKWKDRGICVEGPFDVWRMGFSAFAVLGISYKPEQIRVIARMFKSVVVIFDDEPQAQARADRLIHELRFRGISMAKELIEGDPGGMSQKDADHLVKQIL